MYRSDPCACQHGHDCLRDHRHVDDDPVAFPDPQTFQGAGKASGLITKLRIGICPNRIGNRTVEDQGWLGPTAVRHVQIKGVVASVDLSAGEPSVHRRPGILEYMNPSGVPVDIVRRLAPE